MLCIRNYWFTLHFVLAMRGTSFVLYEFVSSRMNLILSYIKRGLNNLYCEQGYWFEQYTGVSTKTCWDEF